MTPHPINLSSVRVVQAAYAGRNNRTSGDTAGIASWRGDSWAAQSAEAGGLRLKRADFMRSHEVGFVMNKLGVALAIAIASAGAASAADLPTKKAVEAAPKPNCFASFWTWLDSSAADCPLSAGPITVYGTIDLNGSYMSSGAARSPVTDKPAYGIQKYSNSAALAGELQRAQHERHRHQAEAGLRPHRGAGLVVSWRLGSGRQSVFGHVR